MPVVSRNALVPYASHEIYALVDAIEEYPRFLPWCRTTTVHSRSVAEVEATLEIQKAGINQEFSTRNSMTVGEHIEIELLDGPFDYLNGNWHFKALGNSGSKVQFDVSYQFSNPFFEMLLATSFEGIVTSLVDAFVHRAENVYGRR